MSMAAYRATMFMIFFNYAMATANFIGGVIFPDGGTQVKEASLPGFAGLAIFSDLANILNVSSITSLALTAGVLALFAFSLLIPTIPFLFSFFALSGVVTEFYIADLPIDWVFKTPIMAGVAIVYYVGISQYAARSNFQGS